MKTIIMFVCLLLAASQVYSQLLEENFDYPTGDSITQHSWITFSGAGTNTTYINNSGLIFPNYFGSGTGNSVTLKNGGQDSYRNLFSTRNTGSLYASFMVKVDTGRTGDYFIAFMDSGSVSNFRGRVHARVSSGALNFGITKAANSDVTVWSAQSHSFDSTYLVVLKYTFVAGASNDLVSLFVFSPTQLVPPSEPAPSIGPLSFPSGDPTLSIGRLILRQGTPGASPTLKIDGIYVDDSWNNNFLPVELSSFTSIVIDRNVRLNWTTSSELNNFGFIIERSMFNFQLSMFNEQWDKVGFVQGNGTTSSSMNYEFMDGNLLSGKYKYRLKQIDYNGNFEYYDLSNYVNIGIPVKYDLTQNYPNPFNPSTIINYELPIKNYVTIKVYNLAGKEVETLVNENKDAGYYSVGFNASNFASGIYFYTITAGEGLYKFTATKKMMIIK